MLIRIKSQKQKDKESKVKLNFAFSPLHLNETNVIWLEFYYTTIMKNRIYVGRKQEFFTKESFWDTIFDYCHYNWRYKNFYCLGECYEDIYNR